MVRKQLISTWVNTKRLLRQQIGQKLDTDDEVCVCTCVFVDVPVCLIFCDNRRPDIDFLCACEDI